MIEMVDIRDMKKAAKSFPEGTALRKLLDSEPDEIPKRDFKIKCLMWLELMPDKSSAMG